MIPELLIEPAASKDCKVIKDLLKACQLPGEDISEALLDYFYLARKGENVIGVIGLEPYGDCGLVRSLAVRECHRNHGLGKALVAEIESRAIADGMTVLYLLTTTADRFFAELGYKVVERNSVPNVIKGASEFRYICPENALCMQKRIAND